MSTPAVTPTNPLAEFGGVSIDAPSPQGTTASTTNPLAEFGGVTIPDQNDSTKATPQQTGEITNDVGQKVIVPKEGESFSDTMKRAVAYHKSLTPEQQKAALDAESGTIPAKAAETLAAAPAIGFAQPATIAGATELPAAANAAKNAVLKQLAEQSPDLFGHEAVRATLQRYAMQAAQRALQGSLWAGGAEIMHSIWDDVFGKKK